MLYIMYLFTYVYIDTYVYIYIYISLVFKSYMEPPRTTFQANFMVFTLFFLTFQL